MTSRGFDDATLPPDVVRLFGALPVRHSHVVGVSGWGATTAQGTGRQHNEDVWGHRGGRSFVVADGMGGRPGGAAAASTAVAALLDALEQNPSPPDWRRVVATVNEAVRSTARLNGHRRSGAALASLHLAGGRATVLHLGDVRVYRSRSGLSELLTVDHNVREQLARSDLDPRRLSLRPGELGALTGFLGDPRSAEGFGVRTLSVIDGDRLVICSDGVYRRSDAAVLDRVGSLPDQAAADLLVTAARQAGSTDDATAMVITMHVDNAVAAFGGQPVDPDR